MERCQALREMSMKQYYHHPNCSKSREALALLQEAGIDVDIILYLEQVLSQETVLFLAKAVGQPVSALVRSSDNEHESWPHLQDDDDVAWAKVLVEHRHLLQRPILVCGEDAVICRPPSLALTWLAEQGHEQA